MPPSETTETSLAADIIRGAAEIAAFIGVDARKCFYLLQTGAVPAHKEGQHWVTTRSRLRRHYTEARYEPPLKEPAVKQPAAAPNDRSLGIFPDQQTAAAAIPNRGGQA
jgi:hypothetical protein